MRKEAMGAVVLLSMPVGMGFILYAQFKYNRRLFLRA